MTLDEVAAAASVSKGGLLHHFPTKQALINGVSQRIMGGFEDAIASYQKADPAVPGAFTRAFLRANLHYDGESCQVCCALTSESRSFPGPMELFRQKSKQWQEQIENDGIDPIIASIVRYAGEGLGMATMWNMPAPSTYDAMIEYLLMLAGAPQSKPKNKAQKT